MEDPRAPLPEPRRGRASSRAPPRRPARSTPERGVMSTLTSSPPPIGPHRPIDELARRRPADRPSVARRVATAGLLAALGISLLLSVPALRPVLHAIREISPWWIVAAVTLELASCVSFVVIFRLFFDRVAGRDARARWRGPRWPPARCSRAAASAATRSAAC